MQFRSSLVYCLVITTFMACGSDDSSPAAPSGTGGSGYGGYGVGGGYVSTGGGYAGSIFTSGGSSGEEEGGSSGGAGEGGQGGGADAGTDSSLGGQGGEGNLDAGPDVDIYEVCEQYGTVLCEKLRDCVPFLFDISYPNESVCVERNALGCLGSTAVSGSLWREPNLAECLSDLSALTCDDFLMGDSSPPSCEPIPGLLPDGASCIESLQCESLYCNTAPLSFCGICQTRVGMGEACDAADDCESGLDCALVDGTPQCVEPALEGQACSDAEPCELGLVCDQGLCFEPANAGEGQTCDPMEVAACSFALGLQCDTELNRCVPVGAAEAGEECGLVGDKVVFCRGGTECLEGVCTAAIADGEACDRGEQPGCFAPAKCMDGICSLPSESLCPE